MTNNELYRLPLPTGYTEVQQDGIVQQGDLYVAAAENINKYSWDLCSNSTIDTNVKSWGRSLRFARPITLSNTLKPIEIKVPNLAGDSVCFHNGNRFIIIEEKEMDLYKIKDGDRLVYKAYVGYDFSRCSEGFRGHNGTPASIFKNNGILIYSYFQLPEEAIEKKKQAAREFVRKHLTKATKEDIKRFEDTFLRTDNYGL